MPHSNQKLTKIIAGRTVSSTSQADGLLTITFGNGSTMKVKTAPASANTITKGDMILKVRQEGTSLCLDMEGGTTAAIQTAEATSSVMLRDNTGKMEYAD